MTKGVVSALFWKYAFRASSHTVQALHYKNSVHYKKEILNRMNNYELDLSKNLYVVKPC